VRLFGEGVLAFPVYRVGEGFHLGFLGTAFAGGMTVSVAPSGSRVSSIVLTTS
jgi:hypothetical protein